MSRLQPNQKSVVMIRGRSQRQVLHRRGMSTILIMVALPALLMFVWLGVEFALILRAGNHAKIAADAIALSAAARLDDGYTAVATAAAAAAAANRAPKGPVSIPIAADNDASSDLLFGYWDSSSAQFVPDLENSTAVQATVRFAADNANGAPGIILAGFFELGFIDLQRTSVAIYNPPSHATTLLIEDTALVTEFGTINAFAGVSVGSSSSSSVQVDTGSRIETAILRTAGDLSLGSESGIGGEIVTNAVIPTNPYAKTTAPSIPSSPEADPGSGGGTIVVSPGWYPNGLYFTSGTYDLSNGIFHLGGDGLRITGTATVLGDGRLIHLTDQNARIIVRNAGSLSGSGYATAGNWTGVSILQANSSPRDWAVSGNATVDLDGLVIAPGVQLTVRGSSGRFNANAAVLYQLNVRGPASSTYDTEFITSPNATAGRARLVD